MALTETDIKALKPDPNRERWVNDGRGLYLRILPSGRRSWVWRKKRDGKTSYITIGEWRDAEMQERLPPPTLPILTARAARDDLAKRFGRRVAPNALTVKDALQEWFSHQVQPRYRVTKNIQVYVNRAIAEFGGRRLQEIIPAEIARFVRTYGKHTPVAANRCLSSLKLALGWCVEMGYLEHNPAQGLTRRVAGGDEESRARVLADEEIREIWRLESPNAKLLRALLLTGCRISELQKAARTHLFHGATEIKNFRPDVDGDWLFIPAQHSKNGRAHYVHLVPETRRQFNGDDPLLFRSVSSTAVQAWARRMQTGDDDVPREPWASIRPVDPETREPLPAWTPHDLRRSFSTRLHGLGVAPHVVEKLLNHTPQGVAAIYNRAELLAERIEATKRWAAALERVVAAQAGAAVTPIKER